MKSLSQNKPFQIALIRDWNAKLKNWYCNDKYSLEGIEIKNVAAQFGLKLIIKEPTHISQLNLITDSGVHFSLHPNCYHQNVFAKLNLHIVYPSPYLQEI